MNIKLLYCVIAVVFLTCAPNKPKVVTTDSTYAGMHKIAATGKSFIQGAADSLAKADEKPVMRTLFTYDYWLDTTEVTQKEYYDITGKKPVADTSVYGMGNDYPVYNVTWYDAILFCNAKSKMLELDTVYTYYGLDTAGGSVRSAASVIINYTKNGFRLPTESEWEFAAREGSSAIPFPHQSSTSDAEGYAWFSPNALNKTNPVAMLKPNKFRLYDMAGNVAEWTNDWKTSYCLDTIKNSVGAPENSDNSIKVIKGGAFNSQLSGPSSIRPSARSLVYPTILSTTAEYIGFRCARGQITAPNYITTRVVSTTTNPSYLTISAIQPIFGTTSAKLVYVNCTDNKRTLCAVDFAKSNSITECVDSTDVYLPVISPNGQYIAYSTRDIGNTGKSHIYIRSFDSLTAVPVRLPVDSAFIPRWWVDPTSKDTFLIYTNSGIDNTALQWTSTKTFMIKMTGKTTSGLPQELTASGSFHDGRSPNGAYIVTGYKNLLLCNLLTNTTQQLFVYPHNGKSSGASEQVCNVSMSPDTGSNGTSLFLDFGYTTGTSSITGSSYGVHEYMFTVSKTDSILSWYHCPAGEYSWENPKWSNNGSFAVACACNAAGETHAVYIVNLHDSTYTRTIEGTQLAQPCLWVDPNTTYNPDSVNLDSLGQYNSPQYTDPQSLLAAQMHSFWLKRKNLEVIIVGDSRASDDVDPSRFFGYSCHNMAIGGGDLQANTTIINNYILNHCPKVKLIIMSIVFGRFDRGLIDDEYFKAGFGLSKGYNYDKSHNFWKKGLPKNFDSLIILPSPPYYGSVDSLGYRHFACNGWSAIGINNDTLWDTNNVNYKSNLAQLKATVQAATAKGIHVLLVNFPMDTAYAHTPNYSGWGASQKTAREIFAQFKNMQATNPLFYFYDAHNYGKHNYKSEDFTDEGHMCENGARKLSDSLNILIHSILAN